MRCLKWVSGSDGTTESVTRGVTKFRHLMSIFLAYVKPDFLRLTGVEDDLKRNLWKPLIVIPEKCL